MLVFLGTLVKLVEIVGKPLINLEDDFSFLKEKRLDPANDDVVEVLV